MRDAGYVKLHRSLLEWEWIDDSDCVLLLVHLMLRVNWKDARWHGRIIPAGTVIIGQGDFAHKMGWSRQKLQRALDKLKSSGEVSTTPGSKWTAVTLVNWAKYQGEDVPTGQQTGQETGSNRAATGQQPGTIEEGKKGRREEGRTARTPDALTWPKWAGPQSRAKWEEFIAYRRAEHRTGYKSQATEQKALDLCARYFPSGPAFVAALDHTMARGWRFPVDPSEHTYPSPPPVEGQPLQTLWNARA